MTETIGILGGSEWQIVKHPPPHDTSTWVKIVAHIRNNKTGEIRVYKTEGIWDDEYNEVSTYIWKDGNYSCDCNRKIFWGYAGNEDLWDDSPCGDGGFSVKLENPQTGDIFHSEDK